VAKRSYPQLERRRGGGTLGSVWNGIVACLAWSPWRCSPSAVAPPALWPFDPAARHGLGNQRLLRYDALAEHAEPKEMGRIFRERRGGL